MNVERNGSYTWEKTKQNKIKWNTMEKERKIGRVGEWEWLDCIRTQEAYDEQRTRGIDQRDGTRRDEAKWNGKGRRSDVERGEGFYSWNRAS
jgi:hypothetical protein